MFDHNNEFIHDAASSTKLSTMFGLLIIMAIAAMLFLSLGKCHFSWKTGAHCHELSQPAHIHPFANH